MLINALDVLWFSGIRQDQLTQLPLWSLDLEADYPITQIYFMRKLYFYLF